MSTPPDDPHASAPERPLTRRELRARREAEEAARAAGGEAPVAPTHEPAPAPEATALIAHVEPDEDTDADNDVTRLLALDAAGDASAASATASASVLTKKRRRMNPWVKWPLLSLAALLIVGAGAASVYLWKLWNTFETQVEVVDNVFAPEEERPAPLAGEVEGAQTILLLGSDVRGEIDDLDDLEGQRSDTMMVVHIPADHENIVVMSIMRDNWVPIPGHGEAKINAAMAYGGLPLVVQTVESFIDTRIDHVAVIDFEGFKGVTTALGGVTVDNPRSFRARSGERFASGEIVLEGDAALAFVRERYAFADGDYTRAKNQQLFIKGVLNSVLSAETLTNPGRIQDLVSSVAPFLKVDSELNLPYIVSLGWEIRDLRAKDVIFFTSPTLGTGSAGGQSIVRVDWKELDNVRAAFRDGSLADYALALSAP